MSYILDALKKSDKQRQQEHVPDLNTIQLELPPGKRKKASWPLPLAALVLVNVLIILFLVMRPNQSATPPQAVVDSSPRYPVETVQQNQNDMAPQSEPEHSPVVSQQPSPAAPSALAHKERTENKSTSAITSTGEQEEASLEVAPEPQENVSTAAAQESEPEGATNIVEQEELDIASGFESLDTPQANDEYTENQEQDQPQQTLLVEPVESGLSEQQTSLVEKALHVYQLPESIQQQLPEIHIDAHLFYKDKPASRFASINGKIMREGHLLAPDLKVAEISSDGVVFSYQKYLFYVSVF